MLAVCSRGWLRSSLFPKLSRKTHPDKHDKEKKTTTQENKERTTPKRDERRCREGAPKRRNAKHAQTN